MPGRETHHKVRIGPELSKDLTRQPSGNAASVRRTSLSPLGLGKKGQKFRIVPELSNSRTPHPSESTHWSSVIKLPVAELILQVRSCPL